MLGVFGQQCCVHLHVASKALKCSNKAVNIGAMTSMILERDDTKVNARQSGQHFGSNSPVYGIMLGVCPGEWEVLELTGT